MTTKASWRRVLSMALALSMVLSFLTISTFATDVALDTRIIFTQEGGDAFSSDTVGTGAGSTTVLVKWVHTSTEAVKVNAMSFTAQLTEAAVTAGVSFGQFDITVDEEIEQGYVSSEISGWKKPTGFSKNPSAANRISVSASNTTDKACATNKAFVFFKLSVPNSTKVSDLNKLFTIEGLNEDGSGKTRLASNDVTPSGQYILTVTQCPAITVTKADGDHSLYNSSTNTTVKSALVVTPLNANGTTGAAVEAASYSLFETEEAAKADTGAITDKNFPTGTAVVLWVRTSDGLVAPTPELNIAEDAIASLTVTTQPTLTYTSGQTFSKGSMAVTATYASGATNTAFTDYTLTVGDDALTTDTEMTVAGFNTKKITVTANGTEITAQTNALTVTPKSVAEPTVSGSYDYNGTERTLALTSTEDYTIGGTTTGKNAGSYHATAALTDKTETAWAGGGTDDLELTWSISSNTPSLTLGKNAVTMRGKAVTISVCIENPEGATTGFPAASKVHLTAKVGEGSPETVTGLTQTGTTGVYTATYTLPGDAGDVGKVVTFSATTDQDTNYDAQSTPATTTVTIADKNETTATLAVKKGSETVTSATYGDSITLTATVTEGVAGTVQFKKGEDNLGSAVTVSNNTATLTLGAADLPYSASPYSLTAVFTPTNADDYKTSTSSAASLTIGKKTLTITGLTATNRAYNGTTTVALSGGTLTGKVGSDAVTATMPTSGTISSADASTTPYTVTFDTIALSGDKAANYELTQPTVTVTISKADPVVGTIAVKSDKTLYTSNSLSEALAKLERTGASTTEGELSFASGVTAIAAGTKTYSFVFTPTDTTNYNTKTVSASLTASEDALASIAVTTPPTTTTYTYGGTFSKTGMVVTATYDSGKTKELDNANVTVSELGNASDTTKTLTVTYKEGNVTKTADLTGITVNKASIDCSGIMWTANKFTYDGTEKTVTIVPSSMPAGITGFTYENNKKTDANDLYTATATPILDDPDNYSTTNISTLNCPWSIAKADQTPSVTTTANLTKSGETTNTLDLNTLVSGYVTGSTVTFAQTTELSGTSLDTSTGVLTAGSTEGDWVGTVTITKANYNDFTATITVNVTNLESQSITLTPSATSVVYGDNMLTLTLANDARGSGAVTYSSSASGVVAVDASTGEATVKGVGTATITATKAADTAYGAAASSVTIIVTKRPITVTAKDVTVKQGVTATTDGFTVTGTLATGDSWSTDPTVEFSPSSPDTSAVAANAAQIVVSGGTIRNSSEDVTSNYDITYVNGTLSVEPNTVTVTFDPNKAGMTPTKATVTAGGTLSTLPTPTLSGWTFDGWFTAPTGGVQITASTMFNSDATVYAHWTETPVYIPVVPTTPTNTNTTNNNDGSTTTTTQAADGTTTTTTKDVDGTTTQSVVKPDGSSTVTVTDKEGNSATIATAADGSAEMTGKDANGTTASAKTNVNGELTEAKATVTAASVAEAAKDGEAVTLPVEVPAATSAESAAEIKIEMPATVTAENPAKVEIPVKDVKPSTVVVIVHEDGTEEVVKECALTEDGLAISVEGDVTVKVVENPKTFTDPIPTWFEEEVQFVASRGIFNGMGDGTFACDTPMSNGMIMQVLFNLDGAAAPESESFKDTQDQWFDDAANWGASLGLTEPDANGNFNGNDDCERQDLVLALYQYAKARGYDVSASVSLENFSDAGEVSDEALAAMQWAVATGIVKGSDVGLEAHGTVTRGQMSAMVARFINNLMG